MATPDVDVVVVVQQEDAKKPSEMATPGIVIFLLYDDEKPSEVALSLLSASRLNCVHRVALQRSLQHRLPEGMTVESMRGATVIMLCSSYNTVQWENITAVAASATRLFSPALSGNDFAIIPTTSYTTLGRVLGTIMGSPGNSAFPEEGSLDDTVASQVARMFSSRIQCDTHRERAVIQAIDNSAMPTLEERIRQTMQANSFTVLRDRGKIQLELIDSVIACRVKNAKIGSLPVFGGNREHILVTVCRAEYWITNTAYAALDTAPKEVCGALIYDCTETTMRFTLVRRENASSISAFKAGETARRLCVIGASGGGGDDDIGGWTELLVDAACTLEEVMSKAQLRMAAAPNPSE